MEQFIEFIDIRQLLRLPRRWLPAYIECYIEIEVSKYYLLTLLLLLLFSK